MTDSEFDALLRRALIDVVHEDYADILEGEPEVPPFTKRHLRRRRKLLADPVGYVRRLARPVWKKALRTAACILLALATLFGTVMTVSPSARAWVVRMYTEWREESTKFSFFGFGVEDSDPSNWRPSYLPEGFVEIEAIPATGTTKVTYSNSLGIQLIFTYRQLENYGAFNIDSQHACAQETTIGSLSATLFTACNDNFRNRLIWTNKESNTAFMLSGKVPVDELIEVAESVKKIL